MRSIGFVFLFSLGCIKDRTGQSWVSAMRIDIESSKSRLDGVEKELGRINARVGDLESLTKSRGKSDIMKMESMEELRIEVANLRNDIEILNREYASTAKQVGSQGKDAQFRLQWLEDRAQQLETQLGFAKPPPPGQSSNKADTQASDNSTSKKIVGTDSGVSDQPKSESKQTEAGEQTDSTVTGVQNSGTQSNSPPINSDKPTQFLSLAADHLRADRAKAAEAVLNQFLKKYPSHPKAVEAKYRLAEAAFNSSQFKSAANRFQAVIDHSDKGYWAPWAMLRQGECFEKLKRVKSARFFYDDVIRVYPNSDAAKEAQDKLAKPPFAK